MEEDPQDDIMPIPKGMKMVWLFGFGLSAMCFLLQMFIFIRVLSSRKVTDLKILTQITIARLANIAFEYALVTLPFRDWALNVCLALYMYTDCALICWMFVFSKNLYDKVIQVFTTKKITFVQTSLLIWMLTLPLGILCPTVLYIDPETPFKVFYKVYAILKFIILLVNLLFFGRIFYIAIKRKMDDTGKSILRMCIVSFILVSISSLQVFVTDLVSYSENNLVSLILCVVNAYQVLVVTYIFFNLVRGFTDESFKQTISKTISTRTNSMSV